MASREFALNFVDRHFSTGRASGGERSGLGGAFSLWTYKARASIPFSAQ
jgi:hypothetical protein